MIDRDAIYRSRRGDAGRRLRNDLLIRGIIVEGIEYGRMRIFPNPLVFVSEIPAFEILGDDAHIHVGDGGSGKGIVCAKIHPYVSPMEIGEGSDGSRCDCNHDG